MEVLKQAREYIDYFQKGYIIAIGVMVVLVGLVILIYRDVFKTGLALGITFLLCGVIDCTEAMLARQNAVHVLFGLDMPPDILQWSTTSIENILSPLSTFGIGLIAAGVVLLGVAVIYRMRTTRSQGRGSPDISAQ
jgi:hypothetical protein